MQGLIENYNEIYQKIRSLNKEIIACRDEMDRISDRRNEELPLRIENLKNQLQKIDDYQMKIDGFMKLAEKHMTSKNVATIEAPPGYRVNLNRLRNWSMMIDPMSEDDSYAQRVYLVASCDKYFLEKKKAEFTERIDELERDYAVGAPQELKALEEKIKQVQGEIRKYLSSDAVSSFAERVNAENERNIYLDPPVQYIAAVKEPTYWIPGAYGTALDVDVSERRALKGLLGGYYDDKNSKVYLPIESISSDEEFAMMVSCIPARKKLNEMDAGIRNLLFQIIDQSPAGARRVYVIDAVRLNSALVGSLKEIEGSFALQGVPRNPEQIQATLEELVSSFSDIDDVLENHDTVIEYNKSVPPDKQITRSVVVLVGWPKVFEKENKDYINRIITNYERYGISFIVVNISAQKDKEDDFGISDYVGENMIRIRMSSKETTVAFGQEAPHAFAWYQFKHILGNEYCDTLKSHNVEKLGLGTEYIKRVDLDNIPLYTRGKKKIDLPYGVDSRDRMHSVSFENESFAAYLMGASGSGKSTLLHTLITGIIRDYHPDDVELWLADFKMSEFSQYIDPMPPHVKYILLDESQELVYDLIDKLTEKMMERQRFFMKNRELKKVENVPSDIHMPVIFVMLDEFSIMSQAINESQEYRLKLQNLLAKGRALGIKFLFSSQTFTSGIAGLTPTAKAQIQLRIAMKGSRDEISETLELAPSQKTDQVQAWVDALPPHYALVKYRVGDQLFIRRVQVMYFKGTAENAYERQKTLIENVRNRMHPVDTYQPQDNSAYLDKTPVVVDGNSYDKFEGQRIARIIEKTQKTDSDSDGTYLSFGVPRLMSNIRFVSITPESRENLVLFAPMSEYACAVSVLLSIYKECKSQGVEVEIWAYERNKVYRTYAKLFTDAVKYSTMADLCDAIARYKKGIKNGTVENKMILMFGIDRICSEFEFVNGYIASENTEDVPFNEAVREKEQELEQELEQSGAVAQSEDQMALVMLALQEVNNNLGVVENIQDDQEEAIEGDDSHEEDAIVTDEENAGGNTENSDTPERKGVYNALGDLQFVIKQGSRAGYHFCALFSNLSDLKSSGIRIDWFRHRLAFQTSDDDSRDIFGTKIAGSLPEHVCEYSDMMEKFSFRPYLHQGVDWDGWTVDEDGNRISPLNII